MLDAARLSGAGTPFDWQLAIGYGRAPFASMLVGAGACIAGPDGVAVGCFAWVDPDTGQSRNVQSDGARLGFVLPLVGTCNLLWERVYTRGSPPFPQMIIRPGVECVIAVAGQFSAKFAHGGGAGARVFSDPLTGLPFADSDSADLGYVPTPFTLAQSGCAGARLRMSSFLQPFN